MPRREDIKTELAGAKFFSRSGTNSGFHKIPLHEETSRMRAFVTPFGSYRFLRLPFGIASAPEVFEKTLNESFDGISGVKVYVRDMLIWGSTRQEHDGRLRSVLEAARKAGLTFNPEKCEVGVTEILFLGVIISQAGIRQSLASITSVLSLPPPTDKLGVQRMLGVINYFEKFVPALSEDSIVTSVHKEGVCF